MYSSGGSMSVSLETYSISAKPLRALTYITGDLNRLTSGPLIEPSDMEGKQLFKKELCSVSVTKCQVAVFWGQR